MSDYVREAGWPIYLVIAAAAVSIVCGVIWARSPRPGAARFLGATVLTLFAFGLMGFVLGLEQTLKHIGEVEESRRGVVFLCGLGESLHNMALAAVVFAVDAVLYLVGCAKMSGASGSGGREPATVPAGI